MPMIRADRDLNKLCFPEFCQPYILGPWRPSEVLACRQACYPNLTLHGALKAFARHGGCPQYVFFRSGRDLDARLVVTRFEDAASEGCHLWWTLPPPPLAMRRLLHEGEPGPQPAYILPPSGTREPVPEYEWASEFVRETVRRPRPRPRDGLH